MQSLPPNSYIALPKLELPASYVCVLRDVDSDSYRIDKTQDPPGFIEGVLGERNTDYGIELLAIVQTSDLDAFESLLRERHDASISGDWMSLDDYQLRELRDSVLRINDFHSSYLTAQQHRHALANPDGTPTSNPVKQTAREQRASGQVTLKGLLSNRIDAANQPRPPVRTRSELWNQELPPARASLRQRIDDKINHLIVNHPMIVVAIVVLIALIALFTIDSTWRYPTVVR